MFDRGRRKFVSGDNIAASVIVTHYNRPEHLKRCIASLEMQTVKPYEVIIADDGSTRECEGQIETIIENSKLNIRCVRQEHRGFRAAANRNNGVREARGEYLFFFDSDLVLFPDVIELHLKYARIDRWLTGLALRLDEDLSARLDMQAIYSMRLNEFWDKSDEREKQSLIRAARQFDRRLFWARIFPTEKRFARIRLASGHLSLFRSAFERVNGFDENYVGWGREDQDLGLRLMLAGIKGKQLITKARAFHLYHSREDRPVQGQSGSSVNNEYFYRKRNGQFRCENGLFKTE